MNTNGKTIDKHSLWLFYLFDFIRFAMCFIVRKNVNCSIASFFVCSLFFDFCIAFFCSFGIFWRRENLHTSHCCYCHIRRCRLLAQWARSNENESGIVSIDAIFVLSRLAWFAHAHNERKRHYRVVFHLADDSPNSWRCHCQSSHLSRHRRRRKTCSLSMSFAWTRVNMWLCVCGSLHACVCVCAKDVFILAFCIRCKHEFLTWNGDTSFVTHSCHTFNSSSSTTLSTPKCCHDSISVFFCFRLYVRELTEQFVLTRANYLTMSALSFPFSFQIIGFDSIFFSMVFFIPFIFILSRGKKEKRSTKVGMERNVLLWRLLLSAFLFFPSRFLCSFLWRHASYHFGLHF